MKNLIVIPLVVTAALVGCQPQAEEKTQAAVEREMQQPLWAGHYEGTTPCMGCLSRCDDCPGMHVTLHLHEDGHFTLVRNSLSGHNDVETLTGSIRFLNTDKTQLELLHVNKRNLLVVDLQKQHLEIRQDETAKPHQMQSDFILVKNI